jgi:hypothetical protein
MQIESLTDIEDFIFIRLSAIIRQYALASLALFQDQNARKLAHLRFGAPS